MGTRIHVFLKHDLPRFDDAAATLARLDRTLPSALAVRDYWHSIDSNAREACERWEAEPVSPQMEEVRYYTGPGSLFLTITPKAAKIHTGGRWRGFLSIDRLREVHLEAFRAIARTLGSASIALCADSRDDVTDVFWANDSQDACIDEMRSAMGSPQASIEFITPRIVAQCEHGVPDVWFLEDQSNLG